MGWHDISRDALSQTSHVALVQDWWRGMKYQALAFVRIEGRRIDRGESTALTMTTGKGEKAL
jgi:hypothetical protein